MAGIFRYEKAARIFNHSPAFDCAEKIEIMGEDYELEIRVFGIIRKFVQILDDRVFVLVIEGIGHVVDDDQRRDS